MRLMATFVATLLVGCAEGNVPAMLARATATPTPTVTPTATATPSPTPTVTPTPTPTPTPMPAAVMADAESAVFIGDWPAAIAAYQAVMAHPGAGADEVAAAELGLAKVYLVEEAYDEAMALLSDRVILPAPSSDPAFATPAVITPTVDVEATILFADVLQAVGAHITASHHYSIVLSVRPELGLYVNEWMGDALQAAGQPVTASQAYSRALTDAETASERVWLLEKIAAAAASDGDYAGAMAAYDGILDIARIPAYRASIMHRAADTALAFGDTDSAYQRLAVLVADYPESDVAHSALVQLVEAGYPVDEMLRGMVNYYGEAYGPAVQAFYRVILGDPDHTGEPHYYAGLSFLEAGSLDLALDEFELLIETHPDDPLVPAAWIGKGRVQVQLGQEALALESYAIAVDSDAEPATIEARDALWAAAKDFEGMDAFDLAADLLIAFADRHPGDERAPQARFQAGLLRYRLGEVEAAQDAWRSQTVWYPYDAQAQAAWYWLGKTYLAAGETLSATEALSRAVSLGAWDFYGLQARDKLEDRATFPSDAVVAVPCDTLAAQQEAEAWLASWLNLESDVDVGVMPADLYDDPRLQRARLLLQVGHFDEARLELEKLRVAMSHDALALYHLALAYRDLGFYRSSISAAAALWRLSPAQEITTLPRLIGCLVYPTYYSELVDPEAAAMDLPSLLVYALLRQESLFEGYAISHAAAHGLMQVIPSTGAAIAEALNWPPDYETADLYRPMVSVRFGAWYLAEQRDFIDGDLFAAMAAYNGGPGNSLRWWTMAEGDPDLFVELIGFSETYRYVRLIREYFGAYYWLYTEAGSSIAP